LKSGFYPFSGPGGKDDSSGLYPKWYYPDADNAGATVHSVQKFLEAVDQNYRIIFSGRFRLEKPEMWFVGQSIENGSLLPASAKSDESALDEQTLIKNFAASAIPEDVRPFPEVLFRMYSRGITTRLLEWSTDAFATLSCSLNFKTSDNSAPADAVLWCLNPSGLNLTARFNQNDAQELIPDGCDTNTAALFLGENEEVATDSRPFAVYGPPSGNRKSVFTVFPNSKEATAIEKLPESAAFLAKIIIPAAAATLISEQLRRYGFL
jgi:hypothetical protein